MKKIPALILFFGSFLMTSNTYGTVISTESAATEQVTNYISNNCNSVVCNNGEVTFTLEGNFLKATTFSWIPDNKLTLVKAIGNQATFKASGSGYTKITARADLNGIYTYYESSIWIGPPGIVNTTDGKGEFIAPKSGTEICAAMDGNPTSYKWVNDGTGLKLNALDDCASVFATGSGNYNISLHVEATNACGTTKQYFWYRVGYDNELRSASIEEQPQDVQSVKIYNLSGTLVYSNDNVSGTFDIKTTPLTDGIYIIEKFDGENKTSEKVMLKR